MIHSHTALILIDVQKGFDDPKWGSRNNLNAEQNMVRLLELCRKHSITVCHVKHNSTEPDSPLRSGQKGNEFKDDVLPFENEVVFGKSVNSGFIGTGLENYLRKSEIENLIIAGLTTDHCVSTTTRMAGNLGFDVFLVEDATATFDRNGLNGKKITAEEIHEIHLASLHREFCQVVSTQEAVTLIESCSR